MGKKMRTRGQFVRLSPLCSALLDYIADREPGAYKSDVWGLAIRAYAMSHPMFDRQEFIQWCRDTFMKDLNQVEAQLMEKDLEFFEIYLDKNGGLSDIRDLEISSRSDIFKVVES